MTSGDASAKLDLYEPMHDPARSHIQPAAARPIHDRAIRAVGVPFFGLIIPQATGLYGSLTWREGAWWLGTAWFIIISFIIWQGNRTLMFWQRARFDWMRGPGWKLVSLIATDIFYTIPVSVTMLVAWYVVGPLPDVDWRAIAYATTVIAVAVLFITQAYETVFLIQEKHEDRLRMAMAERARWQAELETLKGQLTPHFLFNCLNTLSVLIAEEPRTARRFNQCLANLCRYLLRHKDHDLVPLEEELAFFDTYIDLVRMRHLDAVVVTYRGFDGAQGLQVPPASLQLLLENAIKHNACSVADPLPVEVCLKDDVLTVANPIRARPGPVAGMGIGLENLRSRYALIAGRTIESTCENGIFRVALPLVRGSRSSQLAPEKSYST